MTLYFSCMPVKERKRPKIQRGISLTQELNERIREDADRLGMTWNEAAERALARAFLLPTDRRNPAENMQTTAGAGGEAGIGDFIEDDDE